MFYCPWDTRQLSRHHSRHTALIIQRVLPEASYTLWGFFPRRDLANVLFEWRESRRLCVSHGNSAAIYLFNVFKLFYLIYLIFLFHLIHFIKFFNFNFVFFFSILSSCCESRCYHARRVTWNHTWTDPQQGLMTSEGNQLSVTCWQRSPKPCPKRTVVMTGFTNSCETFTQKKVVIPISDGGLRCDTLSMSRSHDWTE